MPQTLKGKVIKGDGYGRKLGFPTINLDLTDAGPGDLGEGVYAGKGVIDGKEYKAGIVIGPGERIEAHLIGYAGDAYGKEAELRIEKFLREFKEYDSEEELIAQIKEDIRQC